jgi:ABC-2 type transport system permease protein
MLSYAGPILRAQWRISWDHQPSSGRGLRFLAAFLRLCWYALWTAAGLVAAVYASEASAAWLAVALPWILAGASAFWQLAPILTANLGASIQLRKLLIYPIPERELFLVELLLRLAAGIEILLVLGALAAGLLRNPATRHWAVVPAFVLFVAFNLLLAAGLRGLLERLLAIRRVREVVVLVAVLCAAVPQLLTRTGLPPGLRGFFMHRPHLLLPWTATARLVAGDFALGSFAVLLAWTAGAYAFGVRQFRRSLTFDAAAAGAAAAPRSRWTDALYRLPGLLLRDPAAALVEKELRSLARSPRFRIALFMGFSFGMIIWWPAFHASAPASPGSVGYPALVGGYALLLIAETVFWNQFGADRAAARLYFSSPVPFRTVLRAKNLASLLVIVFEITMILAVSAGLGVSLTSERVLEAYLVPLTFSLYLLAAGNLSSVHHPRPIDPAHSWGRASGGSFQMYLLVVFPVSMAPLALAYLAGYAFDSRAAFYAVLLFDIAVGIAAYSIATNSAIAAADERKEQFLAALGEAGGPILAE